MKREKEVLKNSRVQGMAAHFCNVVLGGREEERETASGQFKAGQLHTHRDLVSIAPHQHPLPKAGCSSHLLLDRCGQEQEFKVILGHTVRDPASKQLYKPIKPQSGEIHYKTH